MEHHEELPELPSIKYFGDNGIVIAVRTDPGQQKITLEVTMGINTGVSTAADGGPASDPDQTWLGSAENEVLTMACNKMMVEVVNRGLQGNVSLAGPVYTRANDPNPAVIRREITVGHKQSYFDVYHLVNDAVLRSGVKPAIACAVRSNEGAVKPTAVSEKGKESAVERILRGYGWNGKPGDDGERSR